MIRPLSTVSRRFQPFSTGIASKPSQAFTSATRSTKCLAQVKEAEEEAAGQPIDSVQVFRKWGCNDDDLARIFERNPQLRKADIALLQANLSVLSRLGLKAPDLVRIINCRPKFLLISQVHRYFDDRFVYLNSLFESKELLKRAIVTNPSLLTFNFNSIEPALAKYQELGVKKEEFLALICTRPTIIPRTSFNEEKLEYIRKTGLSPNSKLYKYVVAIVGVYRMETIDEKLTNFANFGFSDDEIFELIRRHPLVMTLSIEKIQRNMTFILTAMKFDAKTVLEIPRLLFINLDTLLRPRVLLVRRLQDMDVKLEFTHRSIIRALRMKETRFVQFFIESQPKEVANELMEFYTKAKQIKSLAGSRKRFIQKGFPF
ncbi:uncharacterized protein LOC129315954 [Prosopis cineraria]|uniref:uncharacterized protein LOC129315954 n=1 Tax=Prosopis cineraria TaxID=364024 RepID=UPI00240FA028|nr:uncharacterized protein LOC129315954 [Prosopis cineraria]